MTTDRSEFTDVASVADELPASLPSSSATHEVTVPKLTRSRVQIWGMRSGLSLVDQGLTSGAGFAVNILLARWLPAEVYGAFAVTFAAYLFVSGFHNVLLLEPLSVMGPARHAERLPAYFRAQVVFHALLTGVLAVVALMAGFVMWRVSPGSVLIGALVGGGVALPFMLLLWLVRRLCYVVQRPAVASVGSATYLLFVLAGMYFLGRLGRLGSCTAFLLMGCGSVVAALLLFWRLGLITRREANQHRVSWKGVAKENWFYGRWLVGSTVLFSISSQTQTFLVAAFLGLGATGTLRAMQVPSLVMSQVVTAIGLLVLPTFSYDFGKGLADRLRHKAALVSVALFLAAACFAALLLLLGGRVEHLLYGGKYAGHASLMAVLALIPVCSAFSMGFGMAMRASQKPHFDLLANAIAAPIGVLSAVYFMRWWGLMGAAASMVVSFAVASVVTYMSYRKVIMRNTSSPFREDLATRA
ncbi:MAG TPA: polysaccharide biosynthesis C-terminal domain-containing protein [Bryobacteraceae bacterium]|nr:polysaccharide biosynthesis C-terminal domain-containing protein [Bryobacteraceae bacterium]